MSSISDSSSHFITGRQNDGSERESKNMFTPQSENPRYRFLKSKMKKVFSLLKPVKIPPALNVKIKRDNFTPVCRQRLSPRLPPLT